MGVRGGADGGGLLPGGWLRCGLRCRRGLLRLRLLVLRLLRCGLLRCGLLRGRRGGLRCGGGAAAVVGGAPSARAASGRTSGSPGV